ncbi:MAG: glycosyltransferase family 4 protein, partial [Bacteroidia bacterium]
MRIAVNTRLLIPNRLEGLGTFTHEVLQRMVVQHPEHEFLFLFDRPWDKKFIYADNVFPVYAGPPARHAILFVYWFEFVVPRLLKKYKADIFLSPDGYLSLRSPIKQIPVIHDLNFEHHPELFSLANKLHYKNFFFRFAKKATRIATVSEFSKKDLVKTYNIDEQKIDVVYNGVDSIYQPASKTETDKLKKELTGGKDYFVFVGGLYPRKNLINILKAFDKFKTETNSDIKFLLAGKSYKESEPVFEVHKKLKYKEDIIFLGRIEPREKLTVLLSGSI